MEPGGGRHAFDPDKRQGCLQAGDGFLLCTDGLWPWFADSELAAAISRRTPRQAAELLVDKAAERAQGNGDNCTMAILRLVAP